jgi:ligand-binding sensor domain-containing protein/DNA-binding CsgD family transcriptional regulator
VAQNTIGLPEIINYSRKVYSAGTQSWDIKQDKNGILYFANNDGLLTFDGNYWKTYPLPNKTIVRSLAIDENGRIFVGGQDEVGYFSPNDRGFLVFHSIKDKIPEKDRSFADVWNIIIYENSIFFRTSSKIFQLTDDKIAVFHSVDWRFMGETGSRLVAQDHTKGLLQFKSGIWEPIFKQTSFEKEFLITGLLPYSGDTSLVTTLKNGVYFLSNGELKKFITPDLEKTQSKLIFTAAMVDKDHFILGTKLDGSYIFDLQGTLVQSFSRAEGLQNTNVLSVFFDRDKNLWLGLDNGIDFIAYNSPIKHIYPSPGNEGSGYASLLVDNQLYIGTSNGLYVVPVYAARDLSYVKGSFEPVANTKGQVWNLSTVNQQLLMGHHEGAFLVKSNTATLLDNSSGFWTFLPYYNVLPSSLVVTGTYNGIKLLDYNSSGFKTSNYKADFESARFVSVDNNQQVIWVAHPYKGLYKVHFNDKLQPDIKLYTTSDGLLSSNNNYLFKVKNRIVAATENGIYEYNSQKDNFEPSAYFKDIFNQPNVRYLKEDTKGNIWFVHDKKVGVIDFSGEKPAIIYLHTLTDKLVNGFEYIYPIDNNNVLIGAEKGFFHVNYEKYKLQKSILQTQVRLVKAFGESDSLLYGGFHPSGKQALKIDHPWNSLHFEYSSTSYGQDANIEYSYLLDGHDPNWSEWTKKVEKEYTSLEPGSYTFQVKARNSLGVESTVANYSFTILPPWYRTNWAYGLYTIILFAAGYLLYLSQKKKFALQQKRHEEEQKRLQYLHQLEMEKTEKEIIRLKNEKLEAEIEHKNTELASTAMHLVQKGELLSRIKDEMKKVKKNLDETKTTDDFKKIIKTLNEEDKMDEDWDNFTIHFDKVHSDFLRALKNKFPGLTPNELKLSAYLRMNLSSKEIAQLMNISVRGVEISRYRLRKKLQLEKQTNLFEFLISINDTPVQKQTPQAGGIMNALL